MTANFLALVDHTQYPDTGLATAYIYMCRLLQSMPGIRFQEPMRPLVTCLILGMKYMEDSVYSNKVWATALGVTLKTVNRCEREFLARLQFRLHVSCEQYKSVHQEAVRIHPISHPIARPLHVAPHHPISCTCDSSTNHGTNHGTNHHANHGTNHDRAQSVEAPSPRSAPRRLSTRLSRWVRGIVARRSQGRI